MAFDETSRVAMPPPAHASLRAKVVAGLAWSAVRHWGARLIGLAVFVVLVRYVDRADMGLVAGALAVMAFVELFTDQGLGAAIVQRPTVTQALLNAAFVVNLGVAALICGGVALFAPQIAALMRTPELTDILRFVMLAVLFTALGLVQQALYRRHLEYRWLALRTLLATAVSGVVALVLVLQGYGVWGLAAQAVVLAAASTAMLWLRPQWMPSREFDFRGLRGMLGFGANVFGARLANFGNRRYIDFFLITTAGAATLGVYAVGTRLYHAMQATLVATVGEVAYSGFSRVAAERERLLAAYCDGTAASAAIAVPLFLLTALVAPEFVHVVFGERWLDAAHVMAPMAVLGAVEVLHGYNANMFNVIGRPSINLVLNGVRLGLTLAGLFAARGQPLVVLVWVFVAAQITVSLAEFLLARAAFGLSLRRLAKRLAPFALGCVAMAGVTFGLRSVDAIAAAAPALRLLALGAAAAAAYAAGCATLGRADVQHLVRLVRKR